MADHSDPEASGSEARVLLASASEQPQRTGQPWQRRSQTATGRAASAAFTVAVVALMCTAAAFLSRASLEHSPDVQEGAEVKEVEAIISKDGLSATVRFTHGGQNHAYRLNAASIYAKEARLLKHTEHGEKRITQGPTRTFRGSEPGKKASARLNEDGSVAGLFEYHNFVLAVKPLDRTNPGKASPLLAAYQERGHPHLIRYLPPQKLPPMAEAQELLKTPELMGKFNFAHHWQMAVDPTGDIDRKPGGDLPSDETPEPPEPAESWWSSMYDKAKGTVVNKVNAALWTWGGQVWFPGCFPGDEVLYEFSVGIMTDVKAYESHHDAQQHVEEAVHQASLIYERQMHIRLVIGYVHIFESEDGAPDFAIGCPDDFMKSKLVHMRHTMSNDAERYPFEGSVFLFTGCGNDKGTVGLAYIGTICEHDGSNSGVVQIITADWDDTFIVFAHELGHNFAAHHSFENGMGKTGGIMDYGDGHLHGVYQFNTHHRKKEMCHSLKKRANHCDGKFVKSKHPNSKPELDKITRNSDKSRHKKCYTVSGAGIGAGHQCVFPFTYKGIVYHQCTKDGHTDFWCATSVNEEREAGKWGSCSDSLQCVGSAVECVTIGPAGAGPGLTCKFPFVYKGTKYDACTMHGHSDYWCATEVDADRKEVKGQWGECSRTDFCHDPYGIAPK
mmetsp:Transcript_130014/g.277693  ORF Transcript_130014/g.277693 Transcript_130014/m.277693 type:complete len:671 (-) Transcript_130014:65-2077(-)